QTALRTGQGGGARRGSTRILISILIGAEAAFPERQAVLHETEGESGKRTDFSVRGKTKRRDAYARDTIGRGTMKYLNLGLLSIALTAGLAAPDQPQSPLPTPTGPYSVGRASLQWSDESRPDAASPDGHRQLVVWLWYPSAKTQQQVAAWQPGKWADLYWTRLLRRRP